MHKRIIWTLFFAAFILDFIRLQSEKSSKKPIPKKNKIESPKEEPKQIGVYRDFLVFDKIDKYKN